MQTTFQPHQRLAAWMREQGYSTRQLARELGFSYDYLYKLTIRGDKQVTGNFIFKFIQRFGWEEANKVFDGIPIPATYLSERHTRRKPSALPVP